MTERLYRHPGDRVIAGVAGGLAAWLDIDPSLVRIAWVLLAIFTGGIFVLVYLVMMVVVPLAPPGWTPRPRNGGGYGSAAPGGWQPGPPPAGWGAPPAAWGAPPAGSPGDQAGAPDAWTAAGGSPTPPWGTTPPEGSAPPDGWPPPSPAPAPSSWGTRERGNAGIVVGVVLVVVGVWFLVDQYVEVDWDLLWPVVVMVLGGALIAGALMRGRSS